MKKTTLSIAVALTLVAHTVSHATVSKSINDDLTQNSCSGVVACSVQAANNAYNSAYAFAAEHPVAVGIGATVLVATGIGVLAYMCATPAVVVPTLSTIERLAAAGIAQKVMQDSAGAAQQVMAAQ